MGGIENAENASASFEATSPDKKWTIYIDDQGEENPWRMIILNNMTATAVKARREFPSEDEVKQSAESYVVGQQQEDERIKSAMRRRARYPRQRRRVATHRPLRRFRHRRAAMSMEEAAKQILIDGFKELVIGFYGDDYEMFMENLERLVGEDVDDTDEAMDLLDSVGAKLLEKLK